MKKIINLFKCVLSFIAVTLSFGITSCTNDKLDNSEINASGEKEYILCGGFSEDSARMYCNKDNQHFNWEEGDVLCLYDSDGTFFTSLKIQASDIQTDGKLIIKARLSQAPKYITMSGVAGNYVTDGANLININEGTIASYSVDSNGKIDNKAPILARSEVKITETNGTSIYSFTLQHNIAYVYIKYIKENEAPLQKVYVKTIGGKVALAATNAMLAQPGSNTQVSGFVNIGSVIAVIPGTKLVIAKDENSTPYVDTTVIAGMYTVTRGEENETVYVAGYDGNSAKIWKNGVATTNETGSIYLGNNNGGGQTIDGGPSKATSVFVSNNKVYSAGYTDCSKNSAVGDAAIVWEDGKILYNYTNIAYVLGNILVKPSLDAQSVVVSNGNVYTLTYSFVAGTIKYSQIWKNGSLLYDRNTNASLNGDSHLYSLYVNGDDVYFSGYVVYYGGDLQSPTRDVYDAYWKNGEMTKLTSVSPKAIYVSGNDVYVAGGNQVLKNGSVLYQYGDDSNVRAVFVSGGDVYVAGDKQVWKNDALLHTITDGTIADNSNALYVLDGDVYVAGYGDSNGKKVAKLWKNGVATNLSDGTENSEANAVYVVKN